MIQVGSASNASDASFAGARIKLLNRALRCPRLPTDFWRTCFMLFSAAVAGENRCGSWPCSHGVARNFHQCKKKQWCGRIPCLAAPCSMEMRISNRSANPNPDLRLRITQQPQHNKPEVIGKQCSTTSRIVCRLRRSGSLCGFGLLYLSIWSDKADFRAKVWGFAS